MIVVFQLENVDIPGVRRTVGQVGQGGLPGGRQGRVHGLRPGGVQLRISALLEDLDSLLIRAGIQHLLHPFPGQQPGLHGPDAGGDGQVIGVFDFFRQDTSSFSHASGNSFFATAPAVSAFCKRTRVSKVQLTSTLPLRRMKPPWMGRVS